MCWCNIFSYHYLCIFVYKWCFVIAGVEERNIVHYAIFSIIIYSIWLFWFIWFCLWNCIATCSHLVASVYHCFVHNMFNCVTVLKCIIDDQSYKYVIKCRRSQFLYVLIYKLELNTVVQNRITFHSPYWSLDQGHLYTPGHTALAPGELHVSSLSSTAIDIPPSSVRDLVSYWNGQYGETCYNDIGENME